MRLRPAFVLAALPATLAAQGRVPPFQIGQVNPLPSLSSPIMPATNIQQISMIHLPSDPPNVFLCGTTAGGGLPAALGGVGGSDVFSGSYDVLADVFTPNAEAAALNTTGTEFGLMLHHTGLLAVFDRLPGQPWLASRTAIGQPWQIVGQFTQLPAQGYYDPSIADYRGQTYLLHVLGTGIAMTPINVTNATVTGPSVVIVNAAVAGSTANSPTPVCDPNGQLIGVSHHDVLGSDNDHFMSLDLDPTTPSVLMNDTTTWINNGGFIGGRFFDAEYTPAPYHIFSMDTFWFTGGRAQPGTTMHVRMFSPPTTSGEVYLSLFAASSAFLPAPIPFPPLQGLLGIAIGGPASALILHNNQNGEALVSFTIPPSPALTGTRLPAQCATLAAVANLVYLGNTASLTVD